MLTRWSACFFFFNVYVQSRGAHFTGWYHSHPFDVGVHSNCFLSATDVSTQLSWQSMEDGAGNPFLAIVVDPLRSVAKGVPEIGAFRCYPPSFVPERGLAPDGVKWDDERARNARWGESCVRCASSDCTGAPCCPWRRSWLCLPSCAIVRTWLVQLLPAVGRVLHVVHLVLPLRYLVPRAFVDSSPGVDADAGE